MKRVYAWTLIFALLCGCAPQVPAPDPVTDPEPDSTLMTEPARDPDPVPEPPAPTPEPEPVPEPEPLPVFWDDACTGVTVTNTLSLTRDWVYNIDADSIASLGIVTQSISYRASFKDDDLLIWKRVLTDPDMKREDHKTSYGSPAIRVQLQGWVRDPGRSTAFTLLYDYGYDEPSRFYLCREDGSEYRLSDAAAIELKDLFLRHGLNHTFLKSQLCNDLLECREIWMVKDPERTMNEQEAAEVLMKALTDSLRVRKNCRSFAIVGGELKIRVRKYDPDLHWSGEHLTEDQWCVDDLSDWEYRGFSPDRGLFFDSCATLEYREGAWYLYTWYLPDGTRDLPVQEVVR